MSTDDWAIPPCSTSLLRCCQHVVLETTHAQGLYERLGFFRTGERTQDGVTLTVMQLDLANDSGIDVLRESG